MKVLYIENTRNSRSSSVRNVLETHNMTMKLTTSMMEALNILGIEDFDFVLIESNRTEPNVLTRFMERYKIPFAIYASSVTVTKKLGYVWHTPVHEIPQRIRSVLN